MIKSMIVMITTELIKKIKTCNKGIYVDNP